MVNWKTKSIIIRVNPHTGKRTCLTLASRILFTDYRGHRSPATDLTLPILSQEGILSRDGTAASKTQMINENTEIYPCFKVRKIKKETVNHLWQKHNN